jgi:phage portal protein BeeE
MRLIDRFRASRAYSDEILWSGKGPASGAAMLTTTYGSPGTEALLPQLMSATGQSYSDNSIVFGAILARLSLFSEAQFKWQRMADESLFGSPELRILEKPWASGTTGELLARMIQDVDLTGNAYIWRASPTRLVRLRPDWMTIISEFVPRDDLGRTYREVIGYYYKPPAGASDEETGGEMLFMAGEVAHWSPIPDPWANFRGMSWLTPVIREISADQAMTEYKIKYLANAASPNLLVKYSQRLGKGAAERVAERIQARHGGVDRAFGTLVLDEGADVTVIGNSMEQMNFSTVQAAGENRILIASGVPGIVVGSKEGLQAATYSNYNQAMRRFADITMRPLWRSASACLEKLVNLPGTDVRLWWSERGIAALRQGEKEQADTTLVISQAAAALTAAGYEPDSVVLAVASGDMALLKHPGLPEPAPTPALPSGGKAPLQLTAPGGQA